MTVKFDGSLYELFIYLLLNYEKTFKKLKKGLAIIANPFLVFKLC